MGIELKHLKAILKYKKVQVKRNYLESGVNLHNFNCVNDFILL